MHGAAAALTVARTRIVAQCYCHGLGLISPRAVRERLPPRFRRLSTVPRKALQGGKAEPP